MTGARRAHAVLAVAVAALVLLQAILAGRALFGSWSITVHGVVGNATFALAIATVAATLVARLERSATFVALVLAVVVTAQVGLGYAGRAQPDAAAWHVPNGVLAFGLATHQLGLIRRRTFKLESADRVAETGGSGRTASVSTTTAGRGR